MQLRPEFISLMSKGDEFGLHQRVEVDHGSSQKKNCCREARNEEIQKKKKKRCGGRTPVG